MSEKVIDRIFMRLAATYGAEFKNLYAGVDEKAVKAAWCRDLAGFADDLDSIAWALDHLPARRPNLIEFRELCRKAPRKELPQLPHVPADKARVAQEIAKLRSPAESTDPKDWARRILAKVESGQRVTPIAEKFAREALRI